MVKVLKKTGKIVAFKAAKIQRSINRAAKRVIYAKEAKYIAKKVSSSVSKALRGKKIVKTTTIRKMVLSKIPRAVASSWRKYDKRKR